MLSLHPLQVTVPDPTTVAALAAAQKRIAELEAQVKTLQTSLQKEIKKQKKEKASVARTKKDDKEEKNLRLLLQAVLRQVS